MLDIYHVGEGEDDPAQSRQSLRCSQRRQIFRHKRVTPKLNDVVMLVPLTGLSSKENSFEDKTTIDEK